MYHHISNSLFIDTILEWKIFVKNIESEEFFLFLTKYKYRELYTLIDWYKFTFVNQF